MTAEGPSLHCSWAELAVHDSTKTPYPRSWLDRATALAGEFEALREGCSQFLGGIAEPIRIISAYRTEAQNVKVGGKGASQHLYGRALDLAPPHGLSIVDFEAVCMDQAKRRGIIRGIGVYEKDGHIHIDIRPEIALVTWRG